METYFAYGSNLLKKQMEARCPSVRFIGTGEVPGYELCFPRASDRWNGGVAGLRRDPGGKVEGALYELTESDLARLDHVEGVAEGEYRRERAKVILKDKSEVEAWIYFANVQGEGSFKPSEEYINVMIRGAQDCGLSPEVVAGLQKIKDSLATR
ncbi:MAG: gamma-glutamylcyclotransferase family protein [Nitrospiraceae bacterium]